MKIKQFSLTQFYKNKYAEVIPYLKQKNTQVFTTIILTLLAISFFGIFAINPTLSTIANLQKQLEDSNFVDESLSKKITNMSILQRKYVQLGNDIPVVLSAIPKNPNVPVLISQLYLLGFNTGININNLQAYEVELSKKTDAKPGYASYAFSFSGNGQYTDILKFISSLINFERIVSLDALLISRQGVAEDNSLQVSVRGEAYFKK